jgi:choline dehydrogenase-like flavoprotein
MLGCRCGAKWNAAEFVDQAVNLGLQVRTGARVSEVLIENKRAIGVKGKLYGQPFRAMAETVVVSAGGIGTPRILQASGLKGAGRGMTMDTTVMVYGFIRGEGTGKEPPMSWSWENDADGYMLSTLIDPWLLYPTVAVRIKPSYVLTWPRWGNILGIMIKLKDEISGGVFPDGRISKPLTKNDRERLHQAREVCTKILLEAGAGSSPIFMTPLRGTHPSGTVRVDTMLDRNLKTEIDGLYICDASVFPEALDRPTVLTIIGLARRLAGHLLATES